MNHQNPTLPADIPTTTDSTNVPTTTPSSPDRDLGEGVEAMTESPERARRRRRAWDEMSETDQRVLLESVRARRAARAERDSHELMLWLARATR